MWSLTGIQCYHSTTPLSSDMAGKEEKLCSLSEVSWRMLGTLHCKDVTFFLHAQSVQQLTSQLEELKEQKRHFDNRLGEEVSSVSCRPQEDEGGEVLRLNGLLEKTEKELFETRTQLEAKVSSLHCRPTFTSHVPSYNVQFNGYSFLFIAVEL